MLETGFRCQVSGVRLGNVVEGMQGLRYTVYGLGFKVQGSGFRVKG